MAVAVLLILFATGADAAPRYSAATIVNAATGLPGLAPDTFATIYGEELAFTTRELRSTDLEDGQLPLHLPGTGVRVYVGGISAPVWYVSPTQINFLIPSIAPQGEVLVWILLDGRPGPDARVRITDTAPGLFLYDRETPLLLDLTGAIHTHANPVAAGADVILFATGLGRTVPVTPYRQLAPGPAPLARRTEFRVLINDTPIDDSAIRYAGAAPGFAGLYQINVRLPAGIAAGSAIRIAVGIATSPAVPLPVR